MARVTTIFAMSLAAATALASGSGSSLGGGVSVGENDSGLAGLRQSATGSMLDIDAVVGRSPFQQQQQPGGTSTANIAVSITPAPTAILNNRQLPAPLPAPGGGGGRQPLPNPDTGSAASALASLSAQSSSDVAKASTEGFASGSSVAAAQASSQIASISASLAASLSSAIASITATATPGQQVPITLTVTQTVTGTAAPAQQPPATVIQTQTQTETASATVVVTSIVATSSMNAAQPDLLPAAPTTSNGLIPDPTKDPNLVDLTVSQLAAVIIGTIIGTALAAVLLTLLLTRFAQRRKSGGGSQVYENEQDDSGSQAALRPTYAADEKGGAAPTEQHPAVRTKSHKSNPSESSQRISVFDERPPAGAETAGFGFGPFNWSNVRSSIFGSKSTSPSQSRPQSGQVEFRTAHKRTISNGSKPRLIRLGSRDDRLTPVTEKSHESQAATRSQQPGGLVPLSGPPSRQMSTSPLNLNPPNAPFRNPSGDAVSWGSWGVAPPDAGPKDHMEVLLKQPPRHQHTPSSSSSGSSKIMDANQLQAAMAADGTIDPPPPTRQPSKHERRPSSGTLGVMGSNPNAGSSSRLDGPPDMPYPLPSFAPYEQRQQQQQPPQGSYWSPTVTTSGTDTESPVSSIGALKAFPHPPANVRRSVHGRVQSTSSSRYSAYTAGGGLDRHLSQQSVDSSHRRSASVNSFLLTSNTIHTNGATFSLFPAPAHGTESPPPMPTRTLSNASAAVGRRQPAVPRAISAVAPPMPPLALGGPPSPPALPRGVRSSRPRGSDMV